MLHRNNVEISRTIQIYQRLKVGGGYPLNLLLGLCAVQSLMDILMIRSFYTKMVSKLILMNPIFTMEKQLIVSEAQIVKLISGFIDKISILSFTCLMDH